MERTKPLIRLGFLVSIAASLVASGASAECDLSGTKKMYDPFGWARGGYIMPSNGFVPRCSYSITVKQGASISHENMRAFMTKAELQACLKLTANGKAAQSFVVKRLKTSSDIANFIAGAGIEPEEKNQLPFAVAEIAAVTAFDLGASSTPISLGIAAFDVINTTLENSCPAKDLERKHGELQSLVDVGGRLIYTENLFKLPGLSGQGLRYVLQRAVTYQVDVGEAKSGLWKTKIVPMYAVSIPIELR